MRRKDDRFVSGWPGPARALVERSVARHGGWDRWDALDTVSITMRSLTGLIPSTKGVGRSFPLPSRIVVTPHAFRTVFEDYPAAGERIAFERGAVRVFDRNSVATWEDDDFRRRFDGLAKLRSWGPADAAYFFGYALAYYQSIPFLLTRTAFVHHELDAGNAMSAVTVDFPDDVVTHCRRQRFFFAEDGRVVRHDYVADVIGAWARGCHYWRNYDESSGYLVARTRHVTPRLFGRPLPGVALHAELDGVAVRFDAAIARRRGAT